MYMHVLVMRTHSSIVHAPSVAFATARHGLMPAADPPQHMGVLAGASFCERQSALREPLVASWRAQFESVQHRHRHNNAFLVYSSAYEAPCKRLQ
eukprot:1788553-Prymnesium_polylepis.1